MRGLYSSILIYLKESKSELEYGIYTATFKRSKSQQFFHYQGASYWVLNKIFNEIDFYPKNFQFVDIGSGMGRVAFVAERWGFNKVLGIELDKELHEIASNNLEVVIGKRNESQIEFFCQNALGVSFANAPSIYFLFNPFNQEILSQVIDKILETNQSDIYFVYMNPLYEKEFTKRKFKIEMTIRTRWYKEAVIYSRGALK